MAEHSVKKEQLINWKILKQSEGQLLATNAYALLTSDYFSFAKTQCAVFKGTDRAVFLDKREFTGPIYTQIEEAVDFVLRNIRLGATIDGLVRKEKYELPPEAIREMIINAHCHRNLLDESCIQVAVYDDRLEVTSPGGLYNGLTYEEVMNGHSKIRNKGIANIFSQMGLVEAWGSGIKRILNAQERETLPFCFPLPEFDRGSAKIINQFSIFRCLHNDSICAISMAKLFSFPQRNTAVCGSHCLTAQASYQNAHPLRAQCICTIATK